MGVLKGSDIWFGVVTLMFFACLGAIFFGSAVAERTFWLSVGAFALLSIAAHFSARFLGRFGAAIEALGAFAVGASFAFFYQTIRSDEGIDFQAVVSSGLGLCLISYLIRLRDDREKTAD